MKCQKWRLSEWCTGKEMCFNAKMTYWFLQQSGNWWKTCYSDKATLGEGTYLFYDLCEIHFDRVVSSWNGNHESKCKSRFCLQGHFRFCEALFFLGEGKKAIEANVLARGLCKDNRDGIKDLEDQHEKFLLEMPEPKGIFPAPVSCSQQRHTSHLKRQRCWRLRVLVKCANECLDCRHVILLLSRQIYTAVSKQSGSTM